MPVARVPASQQPVARVLPLLGLPHLDRLFDYYVPEAFNSLVLVGCRVRVRFSGRLVDAIVYGRSSTSSHGGRLSFIDRVISPAPVLTPAIAQAVEMLADRYAGIRSDIVRQAIPNRHAGAEKADFSAPWEDLGAVTEPDLSGWTSYRYGPSFVDAVISRVRPAARSAEIRTWLTMSRDESLQRQRVAKPRGEDNEATTTGAEDDGQAAETTDGKHGRPVLSLVQQDTAASATARIPASEGKRKKSKSGKRRAPDSWKHKQHAPLNSAVPAPPKEPWETETTSILAEHQTKTTTGDFAESFSHGEQAWAGQGSKPADTDEREPNVPANQEDITAVQTRTPAAQAGPESLEVGDRREADRDRPEGVGDRREADRDRPRREADGNRVEEDADPGAAAASSERAAAVPRAAWQLLPGEKWEELIAALAAKVAIDGGGVLIVVPDARDVARVETELRAFVAAKQCTTLEASLGHQARYRRFLSILSGQSRIVVGTRSAAYAPVENLSLIVCMFDSDDSLVDPRAPYCHAREVLTTRSTIEGAALVIGGFTRTAEVELFVETRWMHPLEAPQPVLEQKRPRIEAVGESSLAYTHDPHAAYARIPSRAFSVVREALGKHLPVLVSVPRAGYIPTLACQDCRAPARCRYCNGPLRLNQADAIAPPYCGWCGRPAANHHCLECGSTRLRAVVRGSDRTAEELGRAFINVPVVSSSSDHIIDTVDSEPRIVVATPGAEPRAEDGFGAAIILDTWAVLSRADLRAHEEALTQWAETASRVRADGHVVVMAEPTLAVVRYFLQWNMPGAAYHELASRSEVRFPPTVHMAAIDGPMDTISEFLDHVELPPGAEILGPVDLPVGVRMPAEYDTAQWGVPQRVLIRSALGPRAELGGALRKARALNAAMANRTRMRIQVDPLHIG